MHKQQASFRAGAAAVDVTPPLGTIINGDFFSHNAHSVHDPLYAKALMLKNQGVRLVIVVVDICIMPRDLLDGVKTTITEQLGIPYSHILISSTHTHAAGSVADVHLVDADVAYRQRLPGLIVEAIRQADARLCPARIAFGRVNAPEHVVCRRYIMDQDYRPFNPVTGSSDGVKTNPVGVEAHIVGRMAEPDPELCFLAVRGRDGQWISLLANYGLHYVGDWENGTISADYFGEFASQLQQKLRADDSFVGIMSNGTSGDVNIWDFLSPNRYPTEYFAKSALIGEDLAERVCQQIEGLVWEDNPILAALDGEVESAVNKPTSSELLAARQIMANSDYECLVPNEDGMRSLYAREQVLLYEFLSRVSCWVQAFRIGNVIIGALPGEFFAETGLSLKEKHPHYFTICLANGNVGYVPPAAEMEKGGYETWRCRISCLESGAENMFKITLTKLIQKLKAK